MPSFVLATLYRSELRMLLRDTRTIVIAVVAPLVLFPVLILVMRWVEQRQVTRVERTVYRYAVTGSHEDFAYYKVQGVINRETFDPDTTRAPAAFLHDRSPNPDSLIRAGAIHLVIEGLGADEYRRVRTRELQEEAGSDSVELAVIADLPDVPVIRLHYRADQDVSRAAFERMRERLEELRRSHRDSVYRAHGLVVGIEDMGEIGSENIASTERESGALLGLMLTPLLLVLMLTGGSIVAVDAISGEKERGTLETLLTTAARRAEIVNAKQLAVATVGVAVTLVNLANLLAYVVLGLIELPDSFTVSLAPASLVVLLMLFLPVTVLVSSSLLLLSGRSKSYKEYQLYFPFLLLIFLALAAAAALPGMDLRSAIALVPVVGVGVAVREVMVGELDWPFLMVAFASTGIAAWGAAWLTERTLSTERLISGAELDRADLVGGPALFPRRVLRWFGVLWAILLVTSLWSGPSLGLREQVLFNIVGVLFVGSLLMVRSYRLDPRAAFALRGPPPVAWATVLIGAPAALVTGIGLAELFRRFVPVPDEVIRSFAQFLAAGDLPVWQIALFLAVIPGVFEELVFRGVLVHGLIRRLRPVPLALTAGVVFGFFHLSLWRIVPTAYLGVLLTAVVLLTGSVYPAMLWHALYNALGILPVRMGWVSQDFDLPLWSYPLGVAALGVAFLVLWNARRPYPGLLASPGRLRAS
ncbi:MAG: ABC transporter permease subunit [Gemmatimonadota bacterium]|nr:ABC transporter permease subunit [Gemmatimonadota bacterium]